MIKKCTEPAKLKNRKRSLKLYARLEWKFSVASFISRFIIDNSPSLVFLRKFHDSEFDGVVFWNEITTTYFNLMNAPHRRLFFTKDKLFSSSTVLYFRKNSVLRNLFNKKIVDVIEFGLTRYWQLNSVDARKAKLQQKMQPVFLIKNITGALQICGIVHLISSIVFVLEVVSVRYLIIRRSLDYLTY